MSRPERPPSTIRLTWDDGRDGDKPVWRYHLTWGTEAKPEHEEEGKVTGSGKLGATAEAAELFRLFRDLLDEDDGLLLGAGYDVAAGHWWRSWTRRPGPIPRAGVAATTRGLRATDAQVLHWQAAAGELPWSTWAVERLDVAAKRAKAYPFCFVVSSDEGEGWAWTLRNREGKTIGSGHVPYGKHVERRIRRDAEENGSWAHRDDDADFEIALD